MDILRRLSELVKQEWEECACDWSKLEAEIKRIAKQGRTVKRGRLSELANGDVQRLGCDELDLLDRYFKAKRNGKSLLELLTPPRDAFDILCNYHDIVIYVGSRLPRGNHDYIDAWDFRACAAILQALGTRGRKAPPELENVAFRSRDQVLDAVTAKRRNCAVISIGSPRSCAMTEVLLTDIYNVPRDRCFNGGASSANTTSPIRFKWPKSNDGHPFVSCFESASHHDSSFRDGKSSVADSGAALYHGRQEYAVDECHDYGIVAIRTVRESLTYAVCAGVSGAGTLSAAECLATGLRTPRVDIVESPMENAKTVIVEAHVARWLSNPGEDGMHARAGDPRRLLRWESVYPKVKV